MAKAGGLSRSSINRICCAFALAPHPTETFKLSKDPLFIEKARDIVALYLAPPDKAMVLAVDEKTEDTDSGTGSFSSRPLPVRPGRAQRRRHDYTHHGTSSLFAALDAKTGKIIGEIDRCHRSTEFLKFLDTIDAAVPESLDVHLILDNYGTHKSPLIHRWLVKRARFHLHFTPTGASWINLVERWFALITEKHIRRGKFRSTK
jgi:transposase